MNSTENIITTVVVHPVTNEQAIKKSFLPDRFVSGMKLQESSIMGNDLGSSLEPRDEDTHVITSPDVAGGTA
jgi:hypothetical protein